MFPRAPQHSFFTRLRHFSYRRTHSQPLQDEKFKILFCGRDEFSCLVFEQLYSARDVWQDIWIATHPDTKTGRSGSKIQVSPLKLLGHTHGLPIHDIPAHKPAFRNWLPPKPFSPLAQSSSLSSSPPAPPPGHLIITASFGRIIPNSVLALFHPTRRLNVHPSLLPAYRGAAPIQHALIRGERETGVCVIEMAERKMGLDAGAIFAQKKFDIPEDVMTPALRDTLAIEGGQLLVSVLRDMLAGKATSVPQAPIPDAPLAPLITGHDAILDFATMTAEEVVRRYRAISHQKSIKVYLPTYKHLHLHSPSVFSCADSSPPPIPKAPGSAIYYAPLAALLVRCAGGTVLHVPRVQEQDRRLLNAKEWWNGVRPELFFDAKSDGKSREEDGRGMPKVVRFRGRGEVWDRVGFLSRGDVWERSVLMGKVERGEAMNPSKCELKEGEEK